MHVKYSVSISVYDCDSLCTAVGCVSVSFASLMLLIQWASHVSDKFLDACIRISEARMRKPNVGPHAFQYTARTRDFNAPVSLISCQKRDLSTAIFFNFKFYRTNWTEKWEKINFKTTKLRLTWKMDFSARMLSSPLNSKLIGVFNSSDDDDDSLSKLPLSKLPRAKSLVVTAPCSTCNIWLE